MTIASLYTSASNQVEQARVLVISDAAPHRNGVGAYYADLIADLAAYVEAVDMVSPEIVGEKWQGGWSLPLPGDKTQKVCLPNAFELKKKLNEFQPTVVVIPTPGLFGLVGAILARRMGITVIVGFHTWFEKLASLYWSRVQGGLTKTYFEWVNKALFKAADKVLANSKEMVVIAHENGAPNASLMGTPLSQSLLDAPLSSVPKKIEKVLFVGRLAAEKNLVAIIEAAERCPLLQFSIAGDGPEKQWLQDRVEGLSNVTLCGWVGRADMIKLIDANDCLVLPSKLESFGTVAMEAMVRQRLAVVSADCGITEWSDLKKGLSVIPRTSSLAKELATLQQLSEFELYSRSMLARRVALEHVKWNRNLWLENIVSSTTNPKYKTNTMLSMITDFRH